jgi:integrase
MAWDPKQRKRRRVEEQTSAKSRSEAREILNEKLGSVSKGEIPAVVSRTRLSELYNDMKADYRNQNQRVDVLEGRWKHLEAFFGNGLAKGVNDTRMQAYIDARRAEGAASATIQNEIAALRRMLNLGYTHRKLAQLPRFPSIRVTNARMVFFTDEELDRLVKALPEVIERDVGNDWLVPFVVTARWIGTRRNELLHLERRQLDLEVGKITLDPGTTKNRQGRIVYLPPDALEVLRAWDESTRAFERERGVIVRQVFHRHGRPIKNFPYELWHSACAKAEIAGRRRLHDFRRTAARSYRARGVPEGIVMQICGWKTRSMFDRYDIKNEDDLRDAAAQVGMVRVMGGKPRIVGVEGPKSAR